MASDTKMQPFILKANTFQRMVMLNVMMGIKGDTKTQRQAAKCLDVLEFAPAERAQVGFKTDDKTGVWEIDAEHKDHIWELTFADPDPLALLKTQMDQASKILDAGTWRKCLSIYDQFKLGISE